MRRKLLLVTYLSPGDLTVFTATIRDLHKAYPNQFLTDIDVSRPAIFENNPYITKLDWHKEDPKEGETIPPHENYSGHRIIKHDQEIEIIRCNYDGNYPGSINKSCTGVHHFLFGYIHDLERKINKIIPLTEFRGDIHISELEKSWISQIEEMGIKNKFWIMMAGGKFDFTCKWWNPKKYQAIVDHFKGKLLFVQCGEINHFNPKLKGVINLVGKTDLRQFIRLMYHSSGVICPVTFAMHLSAAVPMKNGSKFRPCIVLAGGREPTQWEAYPYHQFLHRCGVIDCSMIDDKIGCWRSRCQTVGDGDKKDNNICSRPVTTHGIKIPKCMDMISAEEVITLIEQYLEFSPKK
jgi:ADP-heptose:LPS heptosyltransferase